MSKSRFMLAASMALVLCAATAQAKSGYPSKIKSFCDSNNYTYVNQGQSIAGGDCLGCHSSFSNMNAKESNANWFAFNNGMQDYGQFCMEDMTTTTTNDPVVVTTNDDPVNDPVVEMTTNDPDMGTDEPMDTDIAMDGGDFDNEGDHDKKDDHGKKHGDKKDKKDKHGDKKDKKDKHGEKKNKRH